MRAPLDALPTEATPELIDGVQAYVKNGPMPSPNRVAASLRASLQRVKKIVLDDLTAFEGGPSAPGAFDGWLNSTISRCQRWSALLMNK